MIESATAGGRVGQYDRRLHPVRTSPGAAALWIGSIALAYFVTARVSLSFLIEPAGIAAIWPPAGIFLSAILLTRRDLRAPLAGVLFVTDLVAELLAGTPPIVAALYAVALAGDAVLGSWLLLHADAKRPAGQAFGFARARDVLAFLVFAVLLSNGLMSLLAAGASQLLPGTEFWVSWQQWATSDGIGNLLVTPLVLSWASWRPTRFTTRDVSRALEGTTLLAALAVLNYVAFTGIARGREVPVELTYLTFPFLLWAALRLGVRGVSAALITVAGISISLVASGQAGSLASHEDHLAATIVLQLYLGALAAPCLLLAADAAERAEAQEALRRSAHLLETSQAIAQIGSWELDVPTGALDWSDEMYRLHDTSPDAFTPTLAGAIGFCVPESAERVTAEVERLIAQGGTSDMEIDLVTTKGRSIAVHALSDAVVEGGRTRKVAGAFQDITEHRRLEDQLRQSQKMEAIGLLAGGIAHDFNNLLTAIRGFTELELERGVADDVGRDDLEQILLAADRGGSLVRQLLAFSRRQSMETRILDPATVIDEIAPLVGRLLGEHIDLVLRTAPGLGRVKVDPGQLEQVIVNLAVNARDAMPDGGTLEIRTADVSVGDEIAAVHPDATRGPCVAIVISDTGTGMDEVTRAHAFEPFFTTKERGRGSGMGLATVYGIVRQSGGFVDLTSEPGRGTTVTVYLPRVDEPITPADRADVAADGPAGAETILLVEDDGPVRAYAQRVLAGLGYTVLEASTGDSALDLASTRLDTIDLLLTDVVMPGMQGPELAHRLTALRPGLRTMFMSGFAEDPLRKGLPAGRSAVLAKPFSASALGQAVREALDGRA